MKKSALFLAILLPFLLISCSPQEKDDKVPEQKNVKKVEKVEKVPETTSGWTSPHTFSITTVGVPDNSISGTKDRQKSAKENALLKAKKTIIKVFVKAKLESLQTNDPTLAYTSVRKRFSGIIENGKVVSTEYYTNDNCKMVYEVESRNLKKKVEGK